MQLTSFTDYALRTLMYLGLQPDNHLVSVNEVCEQFNMPRNHVIKVTQQLSQLNYITSVRGRQGGIRLNCNLAEVTVGKVIRDFEKRLNPIDCTGTECPAAGQCKLQCLLAKAQRAFLAELDKVFVSEVLSRPDAHKHSIIELASAS
ncbi:HTH-type transcriptional repressor NsrR [Neiella marina]|uniref:HTH-type transcriptional repressor NsrR n=1 Tax=Neiella marina TaxID=508461 RepID=A0A8J2XMF3_9GAMM|nr:Rrf2 family transcriptional regulator [Neiella marina]GGA77981.1 HTH-type transcriptional repressor NsrR [Neiella marina]